MFTYGKYLKDNVTYEVHCRHTKIDLEVVLVTNGTIISAYKNDVTGEYSYNNVKAKELAFEITSGIRKCTSKNNTPMPFELGAMNQHSFVLRKASYLIQLYRGELVGIEINSDNIMVELEYVDKNYIPNNIPYVKLTSLENKKSKKGEFDDATEDELDSIPVRSVEEIALEKEDVTWLEGKKYYVVNDDQTAESLFTFLDNYNGPIAYDIESTGLRMNCFGKINSDYQKSLIKYNQEHPDAQIRADKLVGIIFCVEENVSYYFPCANRKFKNVFEDKNSEYRNRIIQNTKARYTVGEFKDKQSDMADYIRNTAADDISTDVVLMERVRDILHTKHIVTHGGSIEWKTGWMYEIDTNIKDDTMIMHQIMYKFRSTTSNKGEPSNLKSLAKRELGIDQWSLKDFFPSIKDESKESGKVKGGKSKRMIDFSYMDLAGTRIYAPADGDVTLSLFHKYKKDMLENKQDIEYIYNVEIIVLAAMGYMEFYGHRIDESKILGARQQTKANIALIESEIRQLISYANTTEIELAAKLKDKLNEYKEVESSVEKYKHNREAELAKQAEEKLDITGNELESLTDELNKAVSENEEHILNLGSPAQVAELFYDKLQIPFSGDKKSVAKNVIKALLKERDEDGNNKYPIVHLYSKYKNEDTLYTKFFDNLPYFMYPGGYVFSSFGQISTATGRMSCSKPNAQQYPKVITKIVCPRPGYVICDSDYSQIEYRVLTALAHNDGLAKMFSDPDSDYHTLMASLMYEVDYSSVAPEMRSAAKSFNFGIPYGMGLGSLAILLTGKNTAVTREEAERKKKDYFKNQPNTEKLFNDIKEFAQLNGFTRTQFGRERHYSFEDKDGKINNAKKAAALRQAGNAVIQGCLDGETRIQTKELGIVKIKDVVNTHLKVWDGDKWSNGDILYSGKKQKCIVTFSNGQKFICSPIHKFSVIDWDKDISEVSGNKKFVECKNLVNGVKVECNTNTSLLVQKYNEDTSFIVVESVEITDEYIDMYDVCNTDGGYYVADGIITHNTAADIFKIGVARNFTFIRNNNLFGDMLIINMVHDEQLFEINAQKLNVQRILAEIGDAMQFKIEGYPPLYVGAGVGPAWGYAKSKIAEIHPTLLQELTDEAKSIPIFRDNAEPVDVNNILDYFQERVFNFRLNKVREYLTNPENWHKNIHPAIGNLINLQFNYGRGDSSQKYKGPNGEKYTDGEFLMLNIADFIKEYNLDIDVSYFDTSNIIAENEDDNEYEDDDLSLDEFEEQKAFSVVDDSENTFGASIQDMIGIFGTCIVKEKHICGIDARNMTVRQRENVINVLVEYLCEPDDEGANQIVFLNTGNTLKRTGIYINCLDNDELDLRYRLAMQSRGKAEWEKNEGDINNRSNAK